MFVFIKLSLYTVDCNISWVNLNDERLVQSTTTTPVGLRVLVKYQIYVTLHCCDISIGFIFVKDNVT